MLNDTTCRLGAAIKWAKHLDAKRPAKPPQGVYFFECEGFIKVGVASDPQKRLWQAQVGNPFEIRLISFRLWDDAIEREREVHHKLAAYHVRGEWFKVPITELAKLM